MAFDDAAERDPAELQRRVRPCMGRFFSPFSEPFLAMNQAMNILVIGSSQGTGALAVQNALARGHAVTAFARSPDRLTLRHERLRLLKGDFHNPASVEEAVRGQNAVVTTVSVAKLKTFKEQPRYFSLGAENVVAAMKKHGVKRLAVLSAYGVGDSKATMPWLLRKLMVEGILRLAFEDHEREEVLVRGSGLEFVLARPGRLTNGPALKRYFRETDPKKPAGTIARADVADFLVSACEQDAAAAAYLGHAVQLGNA